MSPEKIGPSPEERGIKPEQPEPERNRPTKEDIRAKVDALIRMRDEPGRTRAQYASMVEELKSMAHGGDPHGIRKQDYSGYTDEDFQEILNGLGEPKELDEAPPWR